MNRNLGSILETLVAKAPAETPESYRCVECRDRGWITAGQGSVRPCPCRVSRSIEERLAAAGVGADLLHATRANLHGSLAKVDLSSWPSSDNILTLMGPVGTGKSHLAAALIREGLEAGERCRFVAARVLIDRCRASVDRKERYEDVLAEYRRADRLAVDECWADRRTDFADDVLSGLIRQRHADTRPTIITTNLTEVELERIEPRVTSRITGVGSLAISTVGLPDRRRTAAPTAGGSK